MIEYDPAKQRESAIQSFRDKQVTLRNKVKDGHYRSRLYLYENDEQHMIEVFEGYCERLKQRHIVPISIISFNFNTMYEAAMCFVYLDHLIERLKNNEDPRAILLEVMKQ